MDIIVCVKRVPDVSEGELVIAKDERKIEEKDLVFDVNEWDKYAVEEAILLKEKFGGTVTVVAMGPEETEDTLRRCLAAGADNAIRLTDSAFERSDAFTTARILYEAIKAQEFGLILTGAQASDDGYAQVGPTIAEFLGIPHVTLVTNIEILNGQARVHRELEEGLEEVLEVRLPAVLTIQTGINQPRYVSIMGIRKAAIKEIKTLDLQELGLKDANVGESGSGLLTERLFFPPATKETEILEGVLEETAMKLAQIIRDKGDLA